MATYTPVEVLTGVNYHFTNTTIATTNPQILLTSGTNAYRKVKVTLVATSGAFASGGLYLYKAAGSGYPETRTLIAAADNYYTSPNIASGQLNTEVFVPQGWSIAYIADNAISSAIDVVMTSFTYSMF